MKYVEFFFENFLVFFFVSLVVFVFAIMHGAEKFQKEREAACIKTDMKVETRAGWKHIYDCSKEEK